MENVPNWKHLIGNVIDKELYIQNELDRLIQYGFNVLRQSERNINTPLKHKTDRKEM